MFFKKRVILEGKFEYKPFSEIWELDCFDGNCFQIANPSAIPFDSYEVYTVTASLVSQKPKTIKIHKKKAIEEEYENYPDFGMII